MIRISEPLPPFPRPTHGDRGSGLAHYVSIADALEPLERLGDWALDDPYHQPKSMKVEQPPYDPERSLLKGCITTDGGVNYHYSGIRKFTPRELSLLQTFPMRYQFSGSKSEAKKQIGNAFPPVMAAAIFKTVAKTLEAFDNGLIDAEDEIDDIDAFLHDKEVDLPEPTEDFGSPYRYLVREPSMPPNRPRNSVLPSSLFRRTIEIEPRPREHLTTSPLPRISRARQRVLADARIAEDDGMMIEID
jgi:DNA (cytosine-5)-methyltransferase 1